jgi:UDP-GlcNAc:undecaprenyl-phosphate GlcNAc-1-phosphate transferase
MIVAGIVGSISQPHWALRFWPVPVASLLSALFATWLCRKIALKLGIVDRPDALVKTHKEPTPYLGGVGIFVGLTAGILVGIYYLKNQEYFGSALKWLIGILAGGAIVCLTGALDDIFDIKPWQKILGQVIAAASLVLVGIKPALYYFTQPLGWEMPEGVKIIVGIFVVMVFVLGATNSLNLLDGIDGLCAGVTAIMALGMLILAVPLESQLSSNFGSDVRLIAALVLFGSVLGFWPFNKSPAKIFMGDAGSLLLGFVIAALMTLFMTVHPKWCLCSIIIFGLPILDTAVAFGRRWLNKRPFFVADRGHIYDQMMDRGMSLRRTVWICYGLAAVYVLLGLAVSWIPPWYALMVSIAVFIISAIIVTKLGFLKMEGHRGAIKRNENYDTT